MGRFDEFSKDPNYIGPGILASAEGEIEKEKKGWEILQEVMINCGGCRKPLFGITKVKENPEKHTEFKALCPYCGSDSFLVEVDGEVVVGPAPNTKLVDFDTKILDTQGNQLKIVVKVDKNG